MGTTLKLQTQTPPRRARHCSAAACGHLPRQPQAEAVAAQAAVLSLFLQHLTAHGNTRTHKFKQLGGCTVPLVVTKATRAKGLALPQVWNAGDVSPTVRSRLSDSRASASVL